MANNETFTAPTLSVYNDDIQTADENGLTPLDKNYLRILFKPGYSIQSRELNQAQSLLQAQIDRFGKGIWGSNKPIIGGDVIFDQNLFWAEIIADKVNEDLINTFSSRLNNIRLSQDLGGNEPLEAVPTYIEDLNADFPSDTNTTFRIFFQYKNNVILNDENIDRFAKGVEISIQNWNDDFTGPETSEDAWPRVTIPNTSREPGLDSTGLGVAAKINPGFYFVRGTAAQVDSQYVTHRLTDPEILFTGYATLKITEKEITHIEDKTLLDNANVGEDEDNDFVYNEAFIGADRYQITLELGLVETQDYEESPTLIRVADVVDSVPISRIDAEKNNEALQELLAARTYEESGNYTLKPFTLNIRELWNDGTNDGVYNNTLDLKQALVLDANNISDSQAIVEAEKNVGVNLSSGISYVKGVRSELISPTTLITTKARDTYSDINNEERYEAKITADIGNYVQVRVTEGLPDVDAFGSVYSLYHTPSTGGGDIEIGSCKIQTVEGITGNLLNLYLHEIILNPGEGWRFSDVTYIKADNIISGPENYGAPRFEFVSGTQGILNATDQKESLFKLPVDYVSNVYTLKLFEKRSDMNPISASTNPLDVSVEFTLSGQGESFDKSPDGLLIAYYDASAGANKWTTLTSTSQFSIVPSQPATQLTINITPAFASGGPLESITPSNLDKVRIIYTTESVLTGKRGTKTLTEVDHTGVAAIRSYLDIPVGDPNPVTGDIFELDNVFHLHNLDINNVDWVIISDGQHDTEYRPAKIKLLKTLNEQTTLKFRYWDFNQSNLNDQNFYTINSYVLPAGNGGEVFKEIPKYKGRSLGDYLDFRLRSGEQDRIAIDPGSIITTDINFYLPRRDLVITDTSKKYSVISGKPALDAKYPAMPDNAMAIATLEFTPYTFSVQEVALNIMDNKRFTMFDIGLLEDRIGKLEYYTTLSLLERSAADQSIYSDGGDERFKNGFIVDGFRGHNVGYPSDPAYLCSVRRGKGILYPHHSEYDLPLNPYFPGGSPVAGKQIGTGKLRSGSYLSDPARGSSQIIGLSNYGGSYVDPTEIFDGRSSYTIGLPWKQIPWRGQTEITQGISVQPHEVYAIPGTLELNPEEDTFVAYDDRPPVDIDPLAGVNDAIRFLAEELGVLGTEWEQWITVASTVIGQNTSTKTSTKSQGHGTLKTTTKTTTTIFSNDQVRTGTETYIEDDERMNLSLGRYISSIDIRPWMRSREVWFRAESLRPNTRFYAFFDGINVTNFCKALTPYVVCPFPFVEVPGTEGSLLSETASELTPANTPVRSLKDMLLLAPAGFINTNSEDWQQWGVGLTDTNFDDRWDSGFNRVVSVLNFDSLAFNNNDNEASLLEVHGLGGNDDPPELTNPRYSLTLKSDPTGILQGLFIVPNSERLRFASGEKIFKLTNSSRNITEEETSFCESRFISGGIDAVTEERIINSRISRITRRTVSDARTIITKSTSKKSSSQYYDPVAQTFKTPGGDNNNRSNFENGICLAAADIYVMRKPGSPGGDNAAPGIKVYLTTTNNGYPTSTIIPESESYLPVSKITITNELIHDSPQPTRFYFNRPIYLAPGEQYALCVYSDSPEYFIYVADLGGSDLWRQSIVSSQADVGVFFTSSNASAWSAHQNRDMAFRLHRAEFIPGPMSLQYLPTVAAKVGSVYMDNQGSGYSLNQTEVTFERPYTLSGDGTKRYLPDDIGFAARAAGIAKINVATGAVEGVEITNPGYGYHWPPDVTITDTSGSGAGAVGITYLVQADISAFMLNQRAINIGSATNVTNVVRFGESNYNVVAGEVFEDIKEKGHFINATTQRSSNPSKVIVTLSTNDTTVSPFLDRGSMNLEVRKYTITTNEDTTSRYITRKITLGNPADQLDGYLSINAPSAAANLKIYAELYNEAGDTIPLDPADPNGETWWEISNVSSKFIPINSNRNKYTDVHYYKNWEFNLEPDDITPYPIEFTSFRIKIVLLSSNIVDIPTAKALRFIATS